MVKYSIEDIERYVAGNMSKVEERCFLLRLESDQDLKRMVSGYQVLLASGHDPENWLGKSRVRLQQRLSRKPYNKNFAIAATITLMIALGTYVHINCLTDVPHDFKDAGIPILMGVHDDEMNAIMVAYKQDNVAGADQLLDSYIKQFGSNDTTRYYKGVFLKELGKYEEALKYFLPDSIDQIILKQKAEMQRAICFSHMGEHEKAEEILELIRSNENHLFKP